MLSASSSCAQRCRPSAVELSALSGLSLKKIIALNDALHVENIADLKSACQGRPSQQDQRFWLEVAGKAARRHRKTRDPQEIILCRSIMRSKKRNEFCTTCAAPQRSSKRTSQAPCGGARKPYGGLSSSPRAISRERCSITFSAFRRWPVPIELDGSHCRGRLANGLQAEIVVVKPDDYAGALLAADRLAPPRRQDPRSSALSRIELFPRTGIRASRSMIKHESEIYQRLGLPYIPAEMREDEGEIEAAVAGNLSAAAHARRYSRHDALPHTSIPTATTASKRWPWPPKREAWRI